MTSGYSTQREESLTQRFGPTTSTRYVPVTRLSVSVEALLLVHEQEQDFLKSAKPELPLTTDQKPIKEAPGQEIGRYKLLQKIGEGGFGVVFMAEQVRPVRRKVAVKVIKPGMDSNAVVARFEAERQALAMMDHPNIARVLDGGATEEGRPYFVMELVQGVPITEYCDKNQLNTEERLHLFVSVCKAMQHAHQKGIIHRDLKPSNILITLHDGKPTVKVIDFGVAKAIHQQLTEKTLFTAFGQMVGTPQYMSPEQAEMSGLDVDTRSDIYSLGVLLYELLTGTTPLETERLRSAGYAEMQRLIREEEPPKPSTRLSASGERLIMIAKHRSLSPNQLQKSVRDDLDWIVMKALEKDRARRYETSSGLADDVERFLSHQPVEACPPSSGYRLGKFLMRNRGAVATTSIVMATLLVATVASSYFAWQKSIAWKEAEQARQEAEDESKNAQLASDRATGLLRSLKEELLDNLMDAALSDQDDAWKLAYESAVASDVDQSWRKFCLGLRLFFRADFTEAAESFRQVVEQSRTELSASCMLGISAAYAGQPEEMYRTLPRIRDLETGSHRDSLFKAYSLMLTDSRQSVAGIKEVVRQRPSWVLARAMLGEATGYLIMDTGDAELLIRATNEMKLLSEWLPDSPNVAVVESFLRHLQLRFCEDPKELERLRAAVLDSADKLSRWPSLQFARAWLLTSIEMDDLAASEFAMSVKQGEATDWMLYDYAALCVKLNRPCDSLIRRLRAARNDEPYALLAYAYLLALQGNQKEAADVVKALNEASLPLNLKVDSLAVLLLNNQVGEVQKTRGRAAASFEQQQF